MGDSTQKKYGPTEITLDLNSNSLGISVSLSLLNLIGSIHYVVVINLTESPEQQQFRHKNEAPIKLLPKESV